MAAASSPPDSPAIDFLTREFDRGQYRERCGETRGLTLIYLTLYGSPAYIRKELEHATYADQKYRLTAAHVAVLVGKHSALETIVRAFDGDDEQRAEAFDGRDVRLMTPMHYASALEDTRSMRLLCEARKLEVTIQAYDFFPGWREMFEPEFPRDEDVVCQTVELEDITAVRYRALTGSQFYDKGILLTRSQFAVQMVSWLKAYTERDPQRRSGLQAAALRAKFEENEAFPSLRVSVQQDKIVGVFAGEAIACGRIAGIVSTRAAACEEGQPAVSNPTNLVRDGFPNCVMKQIHYRDGRPVPLLIALRDIEEGEELFIDCLSIGDVSRKSPREPALDRAERFFGGADINLLAQGLSTPIQDGEGLEEFTRREGEALALNYLLGRPSLLRILALRGAVTRERCRVLMGDYSGVLTSAFQAVEVLQRGGYLERREFEGAYIQWIQLLPYHLVDSVLAEGSSRGLDLRQLQAKLMQAAMRFKLTRMAGR